MRQLAMRKHWLLLTCSCVATAMAPPRSLRRSTPRSATTKIRGASTRNAERPDGTTRLARRRFIGAATAFVPGLAVGANLPSDNGAKGDQRGTVAALVPIVRVASGIAQASRAVHAGKLQDAQKALDAIPATEKPFKRLFDEYSEPVSYKQKYKDSNAFVVYYTAWKSKFYGAFVLNHRVVLHASTRCLLNGVAMPALLCSTARPSQDGRVIAEK